MNPSSSSSLPAPPLIPSSSSPPPPPPSAPKGTPATLTDLQHISNTLADRLERQLLHIKDRSFNRVHRKIDAILNKIAAKEDVFREFGAVKRAVAVVVDRGLPPSRRRPLAPTTATTRTDDVEEEEVRRELQNIRDEVAALRAATVNQWTRGLSGSIVRVPPPTGGRGSSGWEDDFPATVREFWRLAGIEKRDALARLAECYAIHIVDWQDWGRIERDDSGAAQFVALRDAVSEYPIRCLRALAAVWGLAFDLLERPPDLVVGGVVVVEQGDVHRDNDGTFPTQQ